MAHTVDRQGKNSDRITGLRITVYRIKMRKMERSYHWLRETIKGDIWCLSSMIWSTSDCGGSISTGTSGSTCFGIKEQLIILSFCRSYLEIHVYCLCSFPQHDTVDLSLHRLGYISWIGVRELASAPWSCVRSTSDAGDNSPQTVLACRHLLCVTENENDQL